MTEYIIRRIRLIGNQILLFSGLYELKLVLWVDTHGVLRIVLVGRHTQSASKRGDNQGQSKSSSSPRHGKRWYGVSVDEALVPALGQTEVNRRVTARSCQEKSQFVTVPDDRHNEMVCL